MDDAITLRQKIESKIELLEKGRTRIFKAARYKAQTSGEYDKVLALTMLRLKSGLIKEFEGVAIEGVTATTVEKIAKGLCWNEAIKKEEGEALYKSLISSIDCIRAELNGLQSVNKFFE